MKRIRTNDTVIVIAGKDKGKQGTVQRVLDNGKLVIGGVNIAKKHQKPNPNLQIPGGIIDREMPIDVSNVAIFNKETNKRDKIGFIIENDKKVRIYKSTKKKV